MAFVPMQCPQLRGRADRAAAGSIPSLLTTAFELVPEVFAHSPSPMGSTPCEPGEAGGLDSVNLIGRCLFFSI
jgi:hypothetical protein